VSGLSRGQRPKHWMGLAVMNGCLAMVLAVAEAGGEVAFAGAGVVCTLLQIAEDIHHG